MSYQPSQLILEKYADVLVNFALGHGQGIKPNDVVLLVVPESAKSLFLELRRAVLKSGGHVIAKYLPEDEERYLPSADFFNLASEAQLKFFPKKYYQGLLDQCGHMISIVSETEVNNLEGVDPKKLTIYHESIKPYWKIRRQQENQGKFFATVALYGTQKMAKDAGMNLEAYWEQIIRGCFLDSEDPIHKWKQVSSEIKSFANRLNALKIGKLHVTGEDADLWIDIGRKRLWAAARGANIPSFEIYTSPDWRGTQGWIRFNQPAYHYGSVMKGVELEFTNGKVSKAKASQGQSFLQELLKTNHANQVGEFSLTDSRHSYITKFMAETLYDENMGGPQGNTHIALGLSYQHTFDGDPVTLKHRDWEELGFNTSAIHMDLISTTRRTVTAHLANGIEKVIYTDGKFVL